MPASVRAAIDAYDGRLAPGDHVLLNDPFAGGTHLNDLTLVTPSFAGERLVGWVANRAHHADVGGAAPGSIPARSEEHTSELQSLMRFSYAVFCLQKKNTISLHA